MLKTIDRQVEKGVGPCLRQWTGRWKRGCGHAVDNGQASGRVGVAMLKTVHRQVWP